MTGIVCRDTPACDNLLNVMGEGSQRKGRVLLVTVANAAAFAVLAALPFLYVEVATASFQPHWLGGTLRQWYDVFLVLLLISLALWVPSALLLSLVSLIRKEQQSNQVTRVPEATAVVLVLLTYGLGLLESPNLLLGLFIASLLMLLTRLTTRLGYPGPSACLFFALPVLAAIGTLPLAHRFLFLQPDRAYRCLAISLAVLASGTALTTTILVLARNAHRRSVAALPAVVLICSALPGLLYAVPEIEARLHKRDPAIKSLLFVTADALRADWCSAYGGHIPTPAMESMAARGVLFERCYSLAPFTMPSLSSLFASKYPPSLTPGASGQQHTQEILSMPARVSYWCDEKGLTFPQRASGGIQQDGEGAARHTALFLANPGFFHFEWINRAFDTQVYLDSYTKIRRGPFQMTPGVQAFLARLSPSMVYERQPDTTQSILQYTKLFLARFRNRPFFLWVHMIDPHSPYDRMPAHALRAVGLRVADIADFYDKNPPRKDPESVAFLKRCYDAEVRYTDWALGEILQEYTRLSMDAHTYFLFSSDHGENFLEHDQPRPAYHTFTLYDEELRVPLVAVGPGIRPKNIPKPVSQIDLIPTFGCLLGVEPASQWQGKSLRSCLVGAAENPDSPVHAQANLKEAREPMQMVIDGPLKLIRGLESSAIELYDLSQDPGEHHRLEEERPAEAARLLDLLEEWSASFPYCFERLEAAGNTSQIAPQADEDFRRALEAMGYL